MKFNWSIGSKEWEEFKAKVRNKEQYADDCIGLVRTGDLCFDLIVAEDENDTAEGCKATLLSLEYNLYTGGIDTGYAYSKTETGEDYPYDYTEGGAFENVFDMSFDEFKKLAESEMQEYITVNNHYYDYKEYGHVLLLDKADQPLNCW